jgi:hypothetical protein
VRRTHFICTIEGCGRPHDCKGLCHVHYNKLKRTGNPLTPSKIAAAGEGWIQQGYRYFTVDGKNKREHHIVVEVVLGKPLPLGAVVHHVDEDRLNNANSNLVVCPNHKYHHLLHARMRALAACGNANWRKCPYCRQYDDPVNMHEEQSGRCVHRECSAKARREALAKRRSHEHIVQAGA